MTYTADAVQLFKDLLRMDTSNPPGNERLIADYLAAIFEDVGVAYEIIEPEPLRASIVARLGPTAEAAAPPIILVSHTDVVAADANEWAHGPFDAEELNGVIYGRGALDTKYLTAMQLTAFLRMQDQPLTRPLYFVASADEEQGSAKGMPRVVEAYEDAFAGGTVINEGGGFYVEHAARGYHLCTAGEKGLCSFRVSIRGESGPSSFPSENNAVDTFLILLDKMAAQCFPDDHNEIAERFEAMLGPNIEQPLLKAFAEYNKRDTFILKRYDAGVAPNALPSEVEFEAQLQLVPSRTRAHAEHVLHELFDGVDAEWEITDFQDGFISNIRNDAFASLERRSREQLGGTELLPVFALGRTDGRFLGTRSCNVYGFGPVTEALPFSEVLTLVHQPDERINRESVELGADIIETFLRDMGSASA